MRQLKNGITSKKQMNRANLFRKVCVAILSIFLFASCQKEDKLIGTWERYGDDLAGMKVKVVKEGETMKGVIVFMPYKHRFVEGDIKWKNIKKITKNKYEFEDLYKIADNWENIVEINYHWTSIELVSEDEIYTRRFAKGSESVGTEQKWRRVIEQTKPNKNNNRQQAQQSLREQIENLIKNNYGSQWNILNDKQANWDKYDLENFILPERKRINNPDYPYIIKGDFDGNGKLDYVATLSKSNDNRMSKLAIILDNGNVYFYDLEPGLYSLGCGTERQIHIYDEDGETLINSVNLKGDGISVGIFETGYSFVIYWTGSNFESIYTGD